MRLILQIIKVYLQS